MRFGAEAIGAVAMIPYVDIQPNYSGVAELTPPLPGGGIAYLDLKCFTGRVTISTNVTFLSTHNTTMLLTEESNNELGVVEQSNNTSESASSNSRTESASSSSRNHSASSSSGNEAASPSNDGAPDYSGREYSLPRLKAMYHDRVGRTARMNKRELQLWLEEYDAKKSTITTSAGSNDSNDEGAKPSSTNTFEVSNDDSDDDSNIDLLLKEPGNPDGNSVVHEASADEDDTSNGGSGNISNQDKENKEPGNPDGNEFVDEASADEDTSNSDGDNVSNQDKEVKEPGNPDDKNQHKKAGWNPKMTVTVLKQYIRDQKFKGRVPKRKEDIIAFIEAAETG